MGAEQFTCIYIWFPYAAFFVLSGYLFNWKKYQQKGFFEFVNDKFKKYVVPYFFLCIVNLIINTPVEIYHNGVRVDGLGAVLLDQLKWIIYSYPATDRMPNCTPLWFLLALCVSEIYMYLFLSNEYSRLKFFILTICVFSINELLNFCNIPLLPWHIDVSLIGLFFMLIGWRLREETIPDRDVGSVSLLSIAGLASLFIFINGKVNVGTRIMNNYFLGDGICFFSICYFLHF